MIPVKSLWSLILSFFFKQKSELERYPTIVINKVAQDLILYPYRLLMYVAFKNFINKGIITKTLFFHDATMAY